MSNFQINDIIQCYGNTDNNGNIIFVETLGNGVITAIDIIYNTACVSWAPAPTLSDRPNLSNLNNFIYKSHKICKKIADNDWVDKDGNRYNDAGIKQ
tara:strand:- start:259 stop:549 length:291 start_codon:yes stop_codon:yes gene_type:complete